MCLYEPPILLATPEVSAAVICSIPLAVMAPNWRSVAVSWIGVSIAMALVYTCMVLQFAEAPPSRHYWPERATFSLIMSNCSLLYWFAIFYCSASATKGLARGDLRTARNYLFGVLGLLGAVAIGVGLLLSAAYAGESQSGLEPLRIASCNFPPFGEGIEGYSWLGGLCIVQMIIAVGIIDLVKRVTSRPAT